MIRGIFFGINKLELNLFFLILGIEIGFVECVLEKLILVVWYLDYDFIIFRSRFKEEFLINKIVIEEKDMVGIIEVKDYLWEWWDSIFVKNIFNNLILVLVSFFDIDDKLDEIVLCLIDFDEVMVKFIIDNLLEIVDKMFNNMGELGKFRVYCNCLLFLFVNEIEL